MASPARPTADAGRRARTARRWRHGRRLPRAAITTWPIGRTGATRRSIRRHRPGRPGGVPRPRAARGSRRGASSNWAGGSRWSVRRHAGDRDREPAREPDLAGLARAPAPRATRAGSSTCRSRRARRSVHTATSHGFAVRPRWSASRSRASARTSAAWPGWRWASIVPTTTASNDPARSRSPAISGAGRDTDDHVIDRGKARSKRSAETGRDHR